MPRSRRWACRSRRVADVLRRRRCGRWRRPWPRSGRSNPPRYRAARRLRPAAVFPGAEQVAQRQRRRGGLLRQRGHHHGRREGVADPLLGEECQQRRRVWAHLVGHQVEAGACAQGGPDFPLGNVEADAGHQGGAAPLIHIEAPVVPAHEVGQGATLDHHALGFAGGARGEDHIQRFAAVERRSRRGTRRTRRERLCDDLHRLPRQVLGMGGEGQGAWHWRRTSRLRLSGCRRSTGT
ncbi:hypothetical protein PA6761_06091 [Pseudomonas aeruginosa]